MFAITTKVIYGDNKKIEATTLNGYRLVVPINNPPIVGEEFHRIAAEALLKVVSLDPKNGTNLEQYTLYGGDTDTGYVFVLVPTKDLCR